MYRVPNQEGKLCIVTGSNSGTGKEAARRLAGAGASVIMAVRNLEKGENARSELRAQSPDALLEVRHLDLADHLQALLASRHLRPQFALARDVAAVALCRNVHPPPGGVGAPTGGCPGSSEGAGA